MYNVLWKISQEQQTVKEQMEAARQDYNNAMALLETLVQEKTNTSRVRSWVREYADDICIALDALDAATDKYRLLTYLGQDQNP